MGTRPCIEGNAATAVVILVIALPLDGFALLRIMRHRFAWETTPVIMLTSRSQPQEVAQAFSFRAGAND